MHYHYETTANVLRPKSFSELAGQEFVVNTIMSSLEQNHFAHAYLFCGPRGVGKTSAARLLALAINRPENATLEKFDYDGSEDIRAGRALDVIEIDGASYTSVENIRSIREEIVYKPVQFSYKVYIIDEVHMLSNSAFNALLKTIEEPPEYVVFIFATTESHKVPATIRSRCQQFIFKKIKISDIEKKLVSVCESNNISADADALRWIAKESDGSLRDAYTLFDQVASFSYNKNLDKTNNKITLEKIKKNLGLAGLDTLNTLFTYCVTGQKEKTLTFISNLFERGISAEQIIFESSEYMRNILLIKSGITSSDILGYTSNQFAESVYQNLPEYKIEYMLSQLLLCYKNLRYTVRQRFELDITFSQLCNIKSYVSQEELVTRLEMLKEKKISGENVVVQEAQESAVKPANKNEIKNKTKTKTKKGYKDTNQNTDKQMPHQNNTSEEQNVSKTYNAIDNTQWQQVMFKVQSQNEKLAVLLENANVDIQNTTASVFFKDSFAYNLFTKQKENLQDIVQDVLGADWNVYVSEEQTPRVRLLNKNTEGISTDKIINKTELEKQTEIANVEYQKQKKELTQLPSDVQDVVDVFGGSVEIENNNK